MGKAKWLALVFLAMLLGCQTARIPFPKASPPADASADAAAKQFAPATGKANLYIARNQESFYNGEPFMVAVDGKLVGYLAPGMFFLVPVDPGPHQVSVSALAGFDKVEGSAKADKDYFYTISKSSSDQGKLSIGIVLFDAMGKMAVRQANLAQGAFGP
jgi:hypothetical protein